MWEKKGTSLRCSFPKRERVFLNCICGMLVLSYGRRRSSCSNAGSSGNSSAKSTEAQKFGGTEGAAGPDYTRVRPAVSGRYMCPAAQEPVAVACGHDPVSSVHR